MNFEQQEELNYFFVETFNRILQYEEAALSAGDTIGLSMKELHILEAVAQMQLLQQNTMSKIAAKLGISTGALTTAIGVLVTKGCLERQSSEQDRRLVWIILTPKGERAELQHRLFHKEMVQMIGNSLTEESLNSLLASLKTLSRFFEQKKEGGIQHERSDINR
ncbi:MAG: MarR family transcriptional regulator [Clostridium sp.]|uniref:MarR family winged helix-turn-helix transcriptional regulator n=1 Tax=Clostridium sp. TaxID=1506 RepID=UPI00290F04FE|nr:MarR family transcriptional regulator [Clostridium sp.]MDU7337964.1 MarR family transcriptional regulator [Clostridium sp.]